MRPLNDVVFNAAVNATVNSAAITSAQMIYASVQATFTDGAASGTIKLQASNDKPPAYGSQAFVPTNWNDIPSGSAAVAAGATTLIPITAICYQWIRVVWTHTGGAGTFTATLQAQDE